MHKLVKDAPDAGTKLSIHLLVTLDGRSWKISFYMKLSRYVEGSGPKLSRGFSLRGPHLVRRIGESIQ